MFAPGWFLVTYRYSRCNSLIYRGSAVRYSQRYPQIYPLYTLMPGFLVSRDGSRSRTVEGDLPPLNADGAAVAL